ncbi:MAG: signal peptidase I [Prevotella sp.]|nr:signal peptidase I [Prevotella sp.]
MRKTAKFLIALVLALLLMLCFRAVVFTICTVDGDALAPILCKGDRVLVNRWSYGLRVGSDEGLIGYTRLGRRAVSRGDIIAFDNPQNTDQVLICRCEALPGDTVESQGQRMVVPGLVNCAGRDYYWMQAIGDSVAVDSHTLGFISEEFIIGRVTTIVYSHDPEAPFWRGWRRDRTLQSL